MRHSRERRAGPHAALTPRESQIADLLVSGLTYKEIARALGISHRTVEVHSVRIQEKTGSRSRTDFVQRRLRYRIGQLEKMLERFGRGPFPSGAGFIGGPPRSPVADGVPPLKP